MALSNTGNGRLRLVLDSFNLAPRIGRVTPADACCQGDIRCSTSPTALVHMGIADVKACRTRGVMFTDADHNVAPTTPITDYVLLDHEARRQKRQSPLLGQHPPLSGFGPALPCCPQSATHPHRPHSSRHSSWPVHCCVPLVLHPFSNPTEATDR
jgi:hypothetical protein